MRAHILITILALSGCDIDDFEDLAETETEAPLEMPGDLEPATNEETLSCGGGGCCMDIGTITPMYFCGGGVQGECSGDNSWLSCDSGSCYTGGSGGGPCFSTQASFQNNCCSAPGS